MAVPARTPLDILARLNSETNLALKLQDLRAGFLNSGADPSDITVEQYTAFIQRELEKLGKVVTAAGIKGE